MQQYFADVDQLISGGALKKKKYRDYVALATQTVEDASRRQIQADLIRPSVR